MKSGIIYSSAASLDGIVERIEEELGTEATVVATGGLAKKIIPYCKKKITLDEELLLKGLLIIYEKIINKKENTINESSFYEEKYMDHFELVSEYKPTGDQPQAIKELVAGFKEGISVRLFLV